MFWSNVGQWILVFLFNLKLSNLIKDSKVDGIRFKAFAVWIQSPSPCETQTVMHRGCGGFESISSIPVGTYSHGASLLNEFPFIVLVPLLIELLWFPDPRGLEFCSPKGVRSKIVFAALCSLEKFDILYFFSFPLLIGKMVVPLGWYPSCLKPPRSPLKGDIPNKYPLYKMYMGLIIKGPPSQGPPPFSLWPSKDKDKSWV